MTAQPSEVFDLLRKIRYDCTAIQAKVTDAINLLNELNLPDQPMARCERCGVETRGPRTLAEHMYTSHDGPLPEHYAEIEARSVDPVEPEEAAE